MYPPPLGQWSALDPATPRNVGTLRGYVRSSTPLAIHVLSLPTPPSHLVFVISPNM